MVLQSKARKGRKRDKHPVANPSLQLQSLLRDANLFTFHALGKVLYNKRIAAGSQGPETGSFSASSEMLEVLPSVNLHPRQGSMFTRTALCGCSL